MRVVFLGTPDFAVPTLEALVRSRHDLVAAVSQPDRARNRKGELLATPVRAAAERLGVPCYAYERIRDRIDELKAFRPDIMVTAAYGQILTQEILDIPAYGVVNVHASLLPKYRGSSPIQWAVINGETETGVTIMQTERGLDCGDILRAVKTSIGENETAGALFDRLKFIGAETLLAVLDEIERGEARPVKQDETQATVCRKLAKEDGKIDWSIPAKHIRNLIRGLNPWPVAYAECRGEPLKIFAAVETDLSEIARAAGKDYKPGEVLRADPSGLTVCCGQGALTLQSVQLPGKRAMSAAEFLAGHKLAAGETLA